MAAKREGLDEVLLPFMNKIDFEELDMEIKQGLKVHFVENFYEVVNILFPEYKGRKDGVVDVLNV